ncbi:MAG: hypothetical protein LIO54_03705 [Oscillospiraceae bacterium]|nr:hypothetical protein [Oscillospiraceae bacterium]
MTQSDENRVLNLLRAGRVSAVDADRSRAQVIYAHLTDADGLPLVSGWLPVLQHRGAALDIAPDNRHSHAVYDTYTGGGSSGYVDAHDHPGSTLAGWMPEVNDMVLVAYLPGFNSDGFILGAIDI